MDNRFSSRIMSSSLLILFSCVMIWSCQNETPIKQAPANQMDSVSYAIGMDIVKFYQKQDLVLQPAMVYQGMEAVLSEGSPLLSEAEAQQVIARFQELLAEKQKINVAKMAAENLAEGQMFFRQNREKDSVVVLASGLQYKVLSPGTGAPPLLSNTVRVQYRGTLLNGTEFESTERNGAPSDLPVRDFLPGLTEALLMMKPGARWMLFIPPELAYGEEGHAQGIPPNSTLIYELELLEILR